MSYFKNKETIASYNDGNFVNGDRDCRETSDYRDFREHEVKCGFCGEIQEDPEAKACNCCLEDEFIKNYTNGK